MTRFHQLPSFLASSSPRALHAAASHARAPSSHAAPACSRSHSCSCSDAAGVRAGATDGDGGDDDGDVGDGGDGAAGML